MIRGNERCERVLFQMNHMKTDKSERISLINHLVFFFIETSSTTHKSEILTPQMLPP